MGLFDSIFKKKDTRPETLNKSVRYLTLSNYRPAYSTKNGEVYEQALIRASIDAKARHISKLKVDILGSAQPQMASRLKSRPNPWQTYSQFLYRLSTILDVHNTAFIVPVYDRGLNVVGYYPVLPERCEVVSMKGEPWLRYRFIHGQTAAVEMKNCAVLTRFQYKDDFFGESNAALDETLDLMAIQKKGIEDGVENAATYKFMAQVNNFTKAEDLKNERLRFSEENLTADAGSGGLLLFPNTYQNIQQLKAASYAVDADQIKVINDNVFMYFGVNEKVIRNEATPEELDAFFNGSIEPFAIQISEALTLAAFTDREISHGARIQATANRLQYMTTTQKVSMAQQLLDRGVMSINEARELFNYEPVEDGDVRTIRGEYQNAGDRLTEGGSDDAS